MSDADCELRIVCRQCGHLQWLPWSAELMLFTLNAFGWKKVTAPIESNGLEGLCDECVYAAAAEAGKGAG